MAYHNSQLLRFLTGQTHGWRPYGSGIRRPPRETVSFRSDHPSNVQDFLAYAEDQGYRDLVECTDYALASLFYAEHYKLRDVWIDAFAHCVGMKDSLVLSPEFPPISKLTKALITRAHREVDAHLGRVSTALRTFLQEDFSPAYLGLTDAARSHLDRFRRFFHVFYTDKFGYWPPPRGVTFPKALYKSMFHDFKSLYDYLVDTTSTADISSQKPASGGICVLQNVLNFDKRHTFTSLPHPLPLLPTYVPPLKKAEPNRPLRQLTLSSQHQRTHKLHTMSGALMAATNILDPHVTNSRIVQAYVQFERAHAINACRREEKLTVMDARKVRWLLIYGTLQYLVSALRAPKQVRDSESSDYPLCYVADPTRSGADTADNSPVPTPSSNIYQAIDKYISESQSGSVSIEPDCQREDYFTPKNMSRRGSMEVSPLKVSRPLRPTSMLSLAQLSRSSRGSRRNSLTGESTRPNVARIHSDDTLTESATTTPNLTNATLAPACSDQFASPILISRSGSETSWFMSRTPSTSRSSQASTRSTDTLSRTPLLEYSQLSQPTKALSVLGIGEPPSRSDSTSSMGSSLWSEGTSAASSESSACDDRFKMSDAEESGLLGGLVPIGTPINSPNTISPTTLVSPKSQTNSSKRHDYRQSGSQFGLNDKEPPLQQDVHAIGVAVSTPPSSKQHVPSDIQPAYAAVETHSLVLEKRPVLLRSMSTPDTTPQASKNGLKPAETAKGSYWGQYKTVIQQRERPRASTVSRSETTSSTPPKIPLSRYSKPSNDDNRGVKSERRLSNLWRR